MIPDAAATSLLHYSRRTVSTLFMAICLLLPMSTRADSMYSFVDQNGIRHFSNAPSDARFTLYKEWRGATMPSRYSGAYSGGATRRSYRAISATLNAYVTAAAQRYGVDADLIRAVMQVESDCNRYAVSRSGARGLMQLMPKTAHIVGVQNSFDARENIRGGTAYLRYLLDTFNNNISLSLAAYNAGPTLVGRLGRVPAISETRNYVREVMALYRAYQSRSRAAALRTAENTKK